jgi:hypothetical protein
VTARRAATTAKGSAADADGAAARERVVLAVVDMGAGKVVVMASAYTLHPLQKSEMRPTEGLRNFVVHHRTIAVESGRARD